MTSVILCIKDAVLFTYTYTEGPGVHCHVFSLLMMPAFLFCESFDVEK